MPCLNCENRKMGCHSSCKKYAEFKRNIDEKKKLVRSQKEEQNIFINYVFEAKERCKRKSGRNKSC